MRGSGGERGCICEHFLQRLRMGHLELTIRADMRFGASQGTARSKEWQ